MLAACAAARVPAAVIGDAGGVAFAAEGLFDLPLETLRAANEAWMPGFMGS